MRPKQRDALRQDSAANREALLGTLKIVAYPLAAVITLAGILGWRSVSDLKATIQNEAKQETALEIGRMQNEIRSRLDKQFQTPELTKMVAEAAREQTGTVLHPLIVREVGTDVARSVAQEQTTIKAAVVVEARNAVNDLRPTLDGIVQTRVNSTVDSAVGAKISTEVAPILQQLQSKEQTSTLIIQAQANDGHSFDQLVAMAFDQRVPTTERQLVLSIVQAIVRQHNSVLYDTRAFIDKRSDDELLQLLSSADAQSRNAAFDSISIEKLKANMPLMMQIMISDPNLAVREAAFRRFAQIRNDPDPKHRIDNLDNGPALLWWSNHQKDFPSKLK